MIEIDCKEMTLDEQLALAAAISDGLSGKVLALVKDSSIVIDNLSKVEQAAIANIVREFVSRRKSAEHYSIESEGELIVVHTPDPLARSRGRNDTVGGILPPNLLKCPFCGFVTQYQEAYVVHVRAHGAIGF